MLALPLGVYLRRNSPTLLMLLCTSTLVGTLNNIATEAVMSEQVVRGVTGYGTFEELVTNLKNHTDDSAAQHPELVVAFGTFMMGWLTMVFWGVAGVIVLISPFEVAAYAALGAPGRLTWRDLIANARQITYQYIKCRISLSMRGCLFLWFGIGALRDWWLAPLVVVNESHLCAQPHAMNAPDGTFSSVYVRSRQLIARNSRMVNCAILCMLLTWAIVAILVMFALGIGHLQGGVTIGLQTTLSVVANAYLFERLLRSV